jgi:flagellar hook assembly protein FlgD
MNTTVEFQIDSPATVDVSIYSIDGALVRTLTAQSFGAGIHALHWDGTDAAGKSVASGTYLARITGGVSAATRLTLVR